MPDPTATPERSRGLLDLTPRETEASVVALGGKPFHSRILRTAVLEKGLADYEAITSLARPLRARLSDAFPIFTGEVVHESRAPDGATKFLTRFGPGATVETVHIPSLRPNRGATLCVSTQIGCPVGCPFCASGQAGLVRNLSAGEILEQFVRGRSYGPLARVVVMGIGEPLLNFEALDQALAAVRKEMGIGARKITVSTVGFPARLDRIARPQPGFQLAISLHSPFDEERDRLVPAMAGTPIDEVLAAADRWFDTTGREVTYEVVLLGGDNDTRRHAEELGRRLRGRRATVNLIPYNPIAEGDRWRRPHPDDVARFQETIQDAGVVTTVRWSRGLEASAACGQLRAQHA